MLVTWRDFGNDGSRPGAAAFRTAAVVVTRNRRALLEQCLAAVEGQTCRPDTVIVVDNASTDETEAFLRNFDGPHFRIERLPENVGGAGGFSHGIRMAAELEIDFIWIMDDDCIPAADALEELLQAAASLKSDAFDFSFVCSRVVDLSGAACNHPVPSTARNASGWPRWADLADRGFILVDECTFVSALMSVEHVRRAGLPLRQMFIWGDDTEYTRRLSRQAPGVFVGSSHVLHKRLLQGELSVHNEDAPGRLPFYRHHYRNRMYLYRHYFPLGRYLALMVEIMWDLVRLLGRGEIRRASLVGHGFIEGLFFDPPVEPLDEHAFEKAAKLQVSVDRVQTRKRRRAR